MDRAVNTLDVAIYQLDLINVAEAMARAARRSVRVRVVTDSDTLNNSRDSTVQSAIGRLRQAKIPIVDDRRRELMHHKFTVVDGEWVQTGSWNYAYNDTFRSNNNQFIARSSELAANYTAEFEKMFVQGRFGPRKPTGVPYPRLSIQGASVRSLFAPTDDVARLLIESINLEARQNLIFLAFSFTHDGLGDALVAGSRAGVSVQGVIEASGSNAYPSEFNKLRQAGLEVYQDGNPAAMHHKVIIIDQRLVAFGSFNFSMAASKDNDENLLMVDDSSLAAGFKLEFERVLEAARTLDRR